MDGSAALELLQRLVGDEAGLDRLLDFGIGDGNRTEDVSISEDLRDGVREKVNYRDAPM